MNVTARVDYAVRAVLELAHAAPGRPLKSSQIAEAQRIPQKYLENILGELRNAGIVRTVRGADGGALLARPPAEITLADVFRAMEGPLAAVRGVRPDEVTYEGIAAPLADVWIAVRASLRSVLERVTVADVLSGDLPGVVDDLTASPGARDPH